MTIRPLRSQTPAPRRTTLSWALISIGTVVVVLLLLRYATGPLRSPLASFSSGGLPARQPETHPWPFWGKRVRLDGTCFCVLVEWRRHVGIVNDIRHRTHRGDRLRP